MIAPEFVCLHKICSNYVYLECNNNLYSIGWEGLQGGLIGMSTNLVWN